MLNLNDPWVATWLGLIPPVFVGFIFYLIMRGILRGDANERKAYSKIEAEERAKLAAKEAEKKQ
ncbi:MAG: hypothetical protein RL556_521 [Actinomycetota bacterium]|jgi:hypothetical protein